MELLELPELLEVELIMMASKPKVKCCVICHSDCTFNDAVPRERLIQGKQQMMDALQLQPSDQWIFFSGFNGFTLMLMRC